MLEQKNQNLSNFKKIIKQLVFAATLICLWFVVLQKSQLSLNSFDYLNWLVPAGLLAVFSPLLALAAAVMDKRWYLSVAAILALGYLLFFPVNFYAPLAIGFLFFGFWYIRFRARFELTSRIKFASSQLFKRVSGILVLVFLLLISFNVYSKVAQQIASDENGFFERLADSVTSSVLPIIERQLPGFNPQMSLDQYLLNSFSSNGSTSSLASTPGQLEANRQQMLTSLGITGTGAEPLTDITRLAIETKINETVKPYARFVPLVYTFAIFSLLRILAIFVEWLGLFIGAALYSILQLSGFIKIIQTQVIAEKIEI